MTTVLNMAIGLILAAAFGVPPAQASPPPRQPLQVGHLLLQPCNVGYGAFCGSFTRPLDPSGHRPGTLSIGFEWYPRDDQADPALGTIAAQEGGPGYSTTGSRDGYVRLFNRLRDHRDILLMDKRGTGKSGAIDCPTLQINASATPRAYAACGAQLGPDAWFYATRFAADDLAALLDQLEIRQIDYYGDSYGTYFGQIFARRHPGRIRTLTLDSAYPAGGRFATPWFPTEYNTTRRALPLVCARAPSCAGVAGDPMDRLRRLVEQVRAQPLRGRAPNASGFVVPVSITPQNLFMLLDFAGNSPTNWRDFDAANRAWLEAGDSLPLLRLMAESINSNGLGGLTYGEFSNGLATAVICADYPQLFDLRAGPELRRAQYRRAIAAKEASAPNLYAPFTIPEAIAAPFQPEEIGVCLDWPPPPPGAGPEPPQGPAPHLPVLTMNGEIDTITSASEGAESASYFGALSNYTIIANAIHEVAIGDGGEWVPPYGGDLARCAGPIVLAYILRAAPVDTSCAHHVRPIRTPAAFVRLADQATLPRALPGNTADPATLRIASAAAETVGDVIARYYQQGTHDGLGLRGGRFVFAPTATGYDFALDHLRWTEDLAVSGRIAWNQYTEAIVADVTLSGVANGRLRIVWNDRQTDAVASLTGAIGPATVAAERYAP
jgi:pimeloyl-ACP methyl ester carboxylesterase